MMSGVSVNAVYVAIMGGLIAALLLFRRPQRFELILEVFQPAALTRVKKLPFVIGRGAGADLAIEHETVSREHARIIRDRKGALCIEDMQSTNGTFVDGERVNRISLRPHQGVRFGAVEARLKLD
jgi:pSer/pThr/pTyr-binding forkhead associated (FHA) protein